MLCIAFRLATPLLQPDSILSVHFLTSSVMRKCRGNAAEELKSALLSWALARATTWHCKKKSEEKNTENKDNMQNLHRNVRRNLNAGPCGCTSTLISARSNIPLSSKVALCLPHIGPHCQKNNNSVCFERKLLESPQRCSKWPEKLDRRPD